MNTVLVVSALIIRGDCVLIGKKIDGPHPAGLGGKWLFPGGRVEAGETVAETLKREVLEETGLQIEVEEEIGEHMDVRADGSTRIIYFACHPCTLELRAGDDLQCVTWVERSQVPACFDQRVIGMLSPEVLAWLQG